MENIVIALGAVAQAIKQVQQAALRGNVSDDQALPLIQSIFKLDSTEPSEIYGGVHNINAGLRELRQQFDADAQTRNLHFGRYLANLLNIQKQFAKNANIQQLLTGRIEHSRRLLDYEDWLSPAMYASLAEAYSQSISKLPTRIQVHGDPSFLKQTEVQNKVRALLLAGVRAAVLWRQVGGRKRQFLFSRRQIVDTADRLIKNAFH